MIEKNIYYNLNNALSYNALFNFIVGNRGAGKTYSAKSHVIRRFIKNKEQFVYVRRFKQETRSVKKDSRFYGDLQGFDDHKFKISGDKFLVDDEVAGFFLTLSTAKIEKSTSFPNVKWIIFDEFILDKGFHYYMPDEVTAFLEFYETIARLRDVKVIFLSNAITINNPYFLYFGIDSPYQKSIDLYYNDGKGNFTKKNVFKTGSPDILVEFYSNENFSEVKKSTRFGKLLAGTIYSDYAIDNEMLRDNTYFVKRKTKTTYQYTLLINGVKVGVWYDTSEVNFYLSNDIIENSFQFTFDKDLHSEGYQLLTKSDYVYKQLIKAFNNSSLFFENNKIKGLFYSIIK